MNKLLAVFMVLSATGNVMSADRYALDQRPAYNIVCARNGAACPRTSADCVALTCGTLIAGSALGVSVATGSFIPLSVAAVVIGGAALAREEIFVGQQPRQMRMN